MPAINNQMCPFVCLFSVFHIESPTFLPGLGSDHGPPTSSISQVAGSTGVYHHIQLVFEIGSC
jgi:hypothetical protein